MMFYCDNDLDGSELDGGYELNHQLDIRFYFKDIHPKPIIYSKSEISNFKEWISNNLKIYIE